MTKPRHCARQVRYRSFEAQLTLLFILLLLVVAHCRNSKPGGATKLALERVAASKQFNGVALKQRKPVWRIPDTISVTNVSANTSNGSNDGKEIIRCSHTDHFCLRLQPSRLNRLNIAPYKDLYKGRSAVILGSGPTLQLFDPVEADPNGQPILYAGCNGVFRAFPKVLDFLFVTHRHDVKREDVQKLKVKEKKFYAYFREDVFQDAALADEVIASGGYQFGSGFPWCGGGPRWPLTDDVGHYEFGGSCSVVFFALQFILYTGVDHLFLVGCDADDTGYTNMASLRQHAGDPNPKLMEPSRIKKQWDEVPHFVRAHYPNVKIKVINPRGLRKIGWQTGKNLSWD